MNRYLEKEWWMEKLQELFPENYGTAEPEWNLSVPWSIHTHWYKSGPFIIGINYRGNKKSPELLFRIVNNSELNIDHTFNLKAAEDEFMLIKAFTQPDLFPLCVNLDWAKPLLEYYFTNSKMINPMLV